LDLFPTITVAGGYTRQRVSAATFGIEVPERGLWDSELRASWELDLFGRVRSNVRGHTALAESAREEARETGRLVAAELAAAYFDLRGGQDQLDVARRNAENQRGTLQLTRDLLDAGRGNEFDTERAQAQVSTTLARIPTLDAQIAAVQHRIGVLVGRDPQALATELVGAGLIRPLLPETLAVGEMDSLIRSRPDVRAAERRLAAETAFVGAAKADYLPRLSVGGTAGFTSTDFNSVGRSGTSRYAVGPVLTWPAFNLGRVKASVDAARAFEAEARARYEQTVLLAREEVEKSLVAYRKTRERLTQLAEAAEASSRAAELARLRLEGGVADFLQVLDAERSLLSAQDQL
ncbi:MAG: TolC family protein, partial [bacterium]